MYNFAIKDDPLVPKNFVLFEKNSKKSRREKMTHEHFRKIPVSPERLNILESCKKHFIRNRFGILTTKFQFTKLKNDFLKALVTYGLNKLKHFKN